MNASGLGVLAIIAVCACDPKPEPARPPADTVPIGPGTRRSVLIPPDTPVSHQVDPGSDTVKRPPIPRDSSGQ